MTLKYCTDLTHFRSYLKVFVTIRLLISQPWSRDVLARVTAQEAGADGRPSTVGIPVRGLLMGCFSCHR